MISEEQQLNLTPHNRITSTRLQVTHREVNHLVLQPLLWLCKIGHRRLVPTTAVEDKESTAQQLQAKFMESLVYLPERWKPGVDLVRDPIQRTMQVPERIWHHRQPMVAQERVEQPLMITTMIPEMILGT
jgi:hypothetical protein